jgi:hypothetical protein
MSENRIVMFDAVAFVWVDAILANFENLFTTTKMASIPSHLGRHVIKSIRTFSNGFEGIGRGL